MKKSFFIALAALLLGGVGGVQAQQSKQKIGDNPYKITQPDAVLEIESTNKGVLLPRVALTATTSPAPLAAHISGMMVYNTVTIGDVTPGVYTNNGTLWVKNGIDSGTGGIYGGSGSLQSGTTTVNQVGNKITFVTDNTATDAFSVDGTTLSIDSKNDRVGIGTATPTAALDVNSTINGFLPPRMNSLQIAAISSPQNGLILYDTDLKCIRFYQNGSWSDCIGSQTVFADCNLNGFNTVALVKGLASSGFNFTATITNNTLNTAGPLTMSVSDLVLGGANAGLTVASVTPASFSVAPGQSQIVTYSITGTPTGFGSLTGTWKKLSLTCNNSRNVDNTLVSALNCGSATFNTAFTDNTVSYFTKIVLPYTGGNGGNYAAQSISSTGVTGMTATLVAGNLAVGAGNLTLTVSGTPSASGNADFSVSIGGKTCTVSMNVLNYSTTNNGSTAELASRSCNAIKLTNNSASDGTYFIDIDGVDGTYTASQAYCDMTHDGGGWTLVSQWGSSTAPATVSTILPSTTGQLSTNYIKTLAGASQKVRIQTGTSQTLLTATGISNGTGKAALVAGGASLGTPDDYTWVGTIATKVSATNGPTPPFDPTGNGCMTGYVENAGLVGRTETTTGQWSAGGFMTLARWVSTNTVTAEYQYKCDPNWPPVTVQHVFSTGTTSITTFTFESSMSLGSSYRATWLK